MKKSPFEFVLLLAGLDTTGLKSVIDLTLDSGTKKVCCLCLSFSIGSVFIALRCLEPVELTKNFKSHNVFLIF